MPRMTDEELAGLVERYTADAVTWNNTEVAQERELAMRSYHGEPYGNEIKGRSAVVTQDVLEVVEWMLPSLLRVFTSGDKVVKFDATGPEDEAAAKQETEVVNHVWNQHNNGFMNFYDAFKDALLQKMGILKVEWYDGATPALETYTDLSFEEYQRLSMDKDVELVEVDEKTAEDEPGDNGGPPMPVITYDVKARPKKKGRVLVECVPPEEFLILRNSRSVDASTFKAHRREVTVSECREMGYDVPDDVGRASPEAAFDMERQQRFKKEGGVDGDSSVMSGSERLVWMVDAYLRVDYDGDGRSELRHIVTIEKKLYDNNEVPDHPFADICPVPMPHKAIGLSIADLVMDLQLIKTTLTRQMLDNLYLTNMPRNAVEATALVNIDEMLDYSPGAVVRFMGPPANSWLPMTVPFVAEKVMPVLEMFEAMKEARSGVTRYNQGIDANSLNKTAAGVEKIMGAAHARIEMVARIFAETGVRRAFLKVHSNLRRHSESGRSLALKLSGSWQEINPRQWKNRTDMTVSVGLGTGDKSAMLGHLGTIAMLQEKIVAMQGGASGPLVTLGNLYGTASQIVENAGLRSPETYFTDPIDPQTGQPRPQPPPPPDPLQQQAEQALQIEQGKLMIKGQEAQQQAQLDREKFQAQMAMDQARLAMDKEKMVAQMALERETMLMKHQLDMEKVRHDHELKMHSENQRLSLEAQRADREHERARENDDRSHGLELQRGERDFSLKQAAKDETGQSLNKLGEGFSKLSETLAKPRKIKRGADGRAEGIE